jgi:hypothetical protein
VYRPLEKKPSGPRAAEMAAACPVSRCRPRLSFLELL